jgi:hypothetical protein
MAEPSEVVDLVKADRPGESAAAPSAPDPRSGRITFQAMADRLTLGLLASVIGAVLVFVSAFLTWSSTNSKSISGDLTSGATTDTLGIDSHRLGGATLVLSIASLALIMVMLLPATKTYAWKVLIGAGALIALLALIELFQIPATLHPVVKGCGVNGVTCSFTRSTGPGVWFTLIAGILVAVGAYVHHIRPVGLRPEAGNVTSRPEAGNVTSQPGAGNVTSQPEPGPAHETVE